MFISKDIMMVTSEEINSNCYYINESTITIHTHQEITLTTRRHDMAHTNPFNYSSIIKQQS